MDFQISKAPVLLEPALGSESPAHTGPIADFSSPQIILSLMTNLPSLWLKVKRVKEWMVARAVPRAASVPVA